MSAATILVVDDDGQVRTILVEYLKSFGIVNIIEAKNGKQALKILQNHSQPIDVVISDWEMPEVDGLTLLRAVRKDPVRASVKFLMVTSQGSQERMKITKAAKARVDAYIVKPFRADVLRQKIENILDGKVDESAENFVEALKEVFEPTPMDPNFEGAPPERYDLQKMDVELVMKLAKAYHREKLYEKAMNLCHEALHTWPDSPDLLTMLGHTYFLMDQFDEAQKYLNEATAIEPYHVTAQTLLSEIRSKKAG